MPAPILFGSVGLVGLFGSHSKDAHLRALSEARQVVERYRIEKTQDFDLSSIPVEFRGALHPRLKNILWHVENTSEKDIGDKDSLRELAEDLGFVHVLCSGKASLETRRNFRTLCFDSTVESLSGMVENLGHVQGTAADVFTSAVLANGIESLETTLGWFSDRPVPQSKKYTADQARTILALGKKALETARAKEEAKPAAAKAARERHCGKCAKKNDTDAAFCKFCGHALGTPRCATCGTEQDVDAVFCKQCGGRVAT